jgi:hypothetical protein
MDWLCQALVYLLTGLGLAVVEKQVEADPEAVAVEQDGVELRVGRMAGNATCIGRCGSVCSHGGRRYWRGSKLCRDSAGKLLGPVTSEGNHGRGLPGRERVPHVEETSYRPVCRQGSRALGRDCELQVCGGGCGCDGERRVVSSERCRAWKILKRR